MRFQRGNLLAQGRLCDVEDGGRAREASNVDDFYEGMKPTSIQQTYLSRLSGRRAELLAHARAGVALYQPLSSL